MADSTPKEAAASVPPPREATKSPKSPKSSPKSSPKARSPEADSPQGILAADHEAPLEADDDDAGSAYSEVESSTASITSSILKYRRVNGRTYHSEQDNANYWGANDDRANEAQDIFHHVQTLSLDGKLHLAPIDETIQKAVDIGTGTGIWAMDFADLYPGTEVIGTDLSPIQPGWVPPNVKFQIDNCVAPWTFEENSVDYVHIRFLGGSIKDWDALFAQAYRCLKPGGYLESVEPSAFIRSDDGTVEDDSAMAQWGRLFEEGGKKLGHPFTVVEDNIQNTAMEAAGFEDIQEFKYKSPIGSWPRDPKLKEVGMYMQASMEQDTEGAVQFMATVLGDWSKEQISVFAAHLRKELRSGKKHGWHWEKVVWGRKPKTGAEAA